MVTTDAPSEPAELAREPLRHPSARDRRPRDPELAARGGDAAGGIRAAVQAPLANRLLGTAGRLHMSDSARVATAWQVRPARRGGERSRPLVLGLTFRKVI